MWASCWSMRCSLVCLDTSSQTTANVRSGPLTWSFAGFMFYMAVVTIFAVVMIYRIAPKYGKKNPMIYLSICSTVGSISIMAIKGFGIAIKLTLGGHNQLTNPSTYVFLIVVVVCILTQMNYFNKALSQFSTNMCVPALPSFSIPAPAPTC